MRVWILFAALICVGPASAQRLRLPVDVSNLPVVRQLPGVIDTVQTRVTDLANARLGLVQDLLQKHPDVLEASPTDGIMVRHQLVAWSPSPEALQLAKSLGFEILSEQAIEGLDGQIVVFGAPKGSSTQKALKALRKADPAGTYDFNDIYLESQSGNPSLETVRPAIAAAPKVVNARVGLIDGGVDTSHPAFRGARISQQGFSGAVVPSAHGTATASLLIGNAPGFSGSAAGAELIVADIYGNAPTGGSTVALIQALGFMARTQVPVISVSLVGPPNLPLKAAVTALNKRGYLIVAAVGNEGPAAKPMYPAAYDGVVGVTGVDARGKVLFEAGRGPQVDLSAPGADMAAATLNGRYATVRGTSYAAPIVTGLLARQLAKPDPVRAASVVTSLEAQGRDLGNKGVDTTYGAGVVGEEFRINLQSLEKNIQKNR